MALTQATRLLQLITPLGENSLFLTSFEGTEEISRLFHFGLDVFSDGLPINPNELVGKALTFSVEVKENQRRFFHGYVSELTIGETDDERQRYHLEVVPWLWFLTRTTDCRIFQNLSVPQIVEKIFKELGFHDYETSGIKGSHPAWEYCVQFRESDFNFVSRLLEQEGIFYYFRHEKGRHVLVLSDSVVGYMDGAEATVDYPYSVGSMADANHITGWQHRYEFTPGMFAHSDYNFETPSVNLLAHSKSVVKLPDVGKYELYEFPGEYEKKPEGQEDAIRRMQEAEVAHSVVTGTSDCRFFGPGVRFQVGEHPQGQEQGRQYVITATQHRAHEPLAYESGAESAGEAYSNSFHCLPSDVVFRPLRATPRPLVSGVQTAVVVGPPGEEIHCDKYGRVKVQFHWDRLGKRDEASSCWIRVAHNLAGRKWGFFSLPRVGQEVVVDFLDGDPDRPLIIGSVYNAEQMPHYDLPSNQTRSYIKTNSSTGGNGFNELMFEDLAGQERLFLHAQKDMDTRVRNDSKARIYGNRHQIIGWEKDGKKGGDQRELIYQDKHLHVKRHQVEHVEGNYQLLIGKGDAQEGGQAEVVVEKHVGMKIGKEGASLLVEGDVKQKIDGVWSVEAAKGRKEKVASLSLTVAGDCNEKTGNHSLQVGQDQQVKVGMNHALEAGQEVHIKGGMKVIIEAGMQLTLKVGGNFVNIGPTGVDIQGTLVNINSGGSAGSGSGCKPQSPEAPDKPDEPKEAQPATPALAHLEKTGSKSC